MQCDEGTQQSLPYLYTYTEDQHRVRRLFLVRSCCTSLHGCRLVQGSRAPLGGDGYRLAGDLPVAPGCSVARSATRATVSSCASGVSGQRSGWARAMQIPPDLVVRWLRGISIAT